MREYSSAFWTTRGSSVVFDKQLLGPLLNANTLVPLRVALSWLSTWPANPPGGNQTILVGGLDTVLEVLSAADAEAFVQKNIRVLIRRFQEQWNECGIVFGFAVPKERFKESIQEEVFFVNRSGDEIPLSDAIWNGAAAHDMWRLMRRGDTGQQLAHGGYYAPRS